SSIVMAAGLVEAGVVGSLIAELQKIVLDVAIKNIYFKSDLDSLVATLKSIEPNLLDIEKYNKQLHRAEQTQPYIDVLNKGKKLVQRCSTIGSWNVCYRYRYSYKLTNYNADLLTFCRVKVQLDQSSDMKEILVKVNQAEGEGGYARCASFVGGFGEDRELMDQVFGLDLPLEELKDVVLLKDSSVVLLSAPGGCGKTTLAKMLCRDPKIQVVGQSLSGRPEVTWRITLDKWSKGQSILDSSSDLLNKLQTSVDALDEIKEKPDLKNCYLDLGSFPEDESIPAIALHDMWVELYNLDEEDMYTYEYLEELSMRNLHDLLRELAIYLSNREPVELRKRVILEITGNKLPKWWAEKLQEPINARLLSISTDEAFSLCLDSIQLPKVEVLILNSRTKNYSLPLFAQKPGQLKVLIIANYAGCPAELNNFSEVDYLSNLKRIRLEHVSISSLGTSLVKLLKLQKMSLIMCEIGKVFDNCNNMFPGLVEIEIACCADLVEFPVGLCKIGHLKKLSITECNELIALPEALGALTSLEVLRLHSCTKLEGLPESIGNLHKLKSLDISDCVSMSRMPVRMNELCDLRTLYMSGCWGLSELPQSVEDLDQQLKNGTKYSKYLHQFHRDAAEGLKLS
ncbi:hypothetical protein RJ640_011629, partial [Escallonia rubra]